MKIWYNVEVQMLGECERTYDLDEAIGKALGFEEDDIDEREIYRLTALFVSNMKPTEMCERVTEVLRNHPEVFYIDVIYRYDAENVPDRFVIWQDGRKQEYTGRIIFEEDK